VSVVSCGTSYEVERINAAAEREKEPKNTNPPYPPHVFVKSIRSIPERPKAKEKRKPRSSLNV
jgi:hypothetical protein